jgi:hypothetical protein
MRCAYLEHANITVRQIAPAVDFLLAALPGWRVRGEGRMDWYGKSIRWLHVGDDSHYLALQDGGEGEAPAWQGHALGVKHLGIVVPDLDALVARLRAAGHAMDHDGGAHPHRRRAYYAPDALLQIEFIEYLSALPAERNAYA